MRFMKNSSMFEAVMARNLTRSSSGVRSSSASCSTRSLNASQVSSRLRYHSGPSRSGEAARSASAAGAPGGSTIAARTGGLARETSRELLGGVIGSAELPAHVLLRVLLLRAVEDR